MGLFKEIKKAISHRPGKDGKLSTTEKVRGLLNPTPGAILAGHRDLKDKIKGKPPAPAPGPKKSRSNLRFRVLDKDEEDK